MSQKKMTEIALLIIDDEPEITDELDEFFSLHGFQCFTANSAHEAIATFNTHTAISIILTDLHMPDLNGIELIIQLKKETEAERHTKAILFTGRSDKNDIIQALRTGFTDFHPKPLDFPAVLEAVQQLYLKQKLCLENINSNIINNNINQLSKQLESLQNILTQHHDYDLPNSTIEANEQQSYSDNKTKMGPEPRKPVAELKMLTPRQREVTYLAADGLTNQQIANTLSIQENTVKLYISQILKSTSLSNRTQLSLLVHKSK